MSQTAETTTQEVTTARPTAVLYLRVSTPSQYKNDYDAEGISLPAQRKRCLAKAAQMGVEVVEEYVEPGRSATSMDKRPAFQDMLARIRRQRDVDYVIVYKLSRMNRNRLDDALVMAKLRQYKATLVSATESIDETPVGQLMHGILATINEYRSAEDGADVRYKMGEKAKRGGTISKAPLGYQNVIERFEGREVRTVAVDPERAPFVQLAFELYATGEYSLQRLREELTERGLRTRPGRYPASPVSTSKLHAMLRNRYYLGVVLYQGAEYPGRHEALISSELFDAVQSVLDASGVAGERRRKHLHYLKGSLWCGRCREDGRTSRLILTRATGNNGSEYFYFLCRGRQEHRCDLPYLPEENVEDAIIRHYATVQFDSAFVRIARQAIRATLADAQASARTLKQQLQAELDRLDKQEENLLDLVAEGGLVTTKARTRLTRLQQQRAKVHERLEAAEHEIEQGAVVLETQLDLLENPQELYRRLDDQGRRLMNQALFTKLLIDEDRTKVRVTGELFTEPTRDLVAAARAYRARQTGARPSERPAIAGGPVEQTSEDLLGAVLDGLSSKTSMVGLAGFEPTTSSTRTTRAPKLRHSPLDFACSLAPAPPRLRGGFVCRDGTTICRVAAAARGMPTCSGGNDQAIPLVTATGRRVISATRVRGTRPSNTGPEYFGPAYRA